VAGIVLYFIFLIVWFAALGKWIKEIGLLMSGSHTGLLAFFFANMNLFVFIAVTLGILFYASFGGNQ